MSDLPQHSDRPEPRPAKKMPSLVKWGLFIAIGLHILAFLLFRVGSNTLPDYEPSKPYVTFVSKKSFAKDVELEEYAILFDSAPLFIPTRWNASQLVEVDFENVFLGPFPEFEPKIELLSELQPNGFLIADNYSVDKPSDLLASRFWRFFEGFGRSNESVSAFEPSVPVAEISIIGESQNPSVSLKVELESAKSFSINNPVSYMIRRSNDGLIWGAPTLVKTSGNELFDQSVARWLQRPDVLAQLPVGYLSIRVFFW
jgi:hypothetical protein